MSDPSGRIRLLALPGSLRASSINRAWLVAIQTLAPADLDMVVWDGLGGLPLFNPDLCGRLPAPVRALHREVEAASALLIASPEYAHGVAGGMKNALDWLVGLETFAGKPVAVINASSRATHADAALREILRTMAARIVDTASMTLPWPACGLDAEGIRRDPACVAAGQALLRALVDGLAG